MPVTKRSSSSAKQSKINFSSFKGSPAFAGKKAKLTDTKILPKDVEEVEDFSSCSESSFEHAEEIEDSDATSQTSAFPLKRKHSAMIDKKDSKLDGQKCEVKDQDQGQYDNSTLTKQRPLLKVNDARWRKLGAKAREVNGNLPLVHAEKENRIHDILRVFDLSYEYGPCYGVSRLDRWERAHAMGLSPPLEIRDILLTRQGVEDRKYAQSVFFDQTERI
ncbi:DNA polymerase delta, subunit 4-domain-containing protein [Lentinula detonsa]|uniref:DNA polymerase delta, subunit 4-domain-containing protein n=1 Tax=Lentinula detonsa TaxID=2804962 RepID=A0A9W8TY78_9AGAR|nr:DNA polymerase delta, subunit 4-domain-containing protein [Lentinula detonsa]